MIDGVKAHCNQVDILVHSVAYSSEIKKPLDRDQPGGLSQRPEYQFLFADGAGARAVLPMMEKRRDGGSVIGLTYIGGDRVVPHYGGGMGTAKAALELDAKYLARNLGPKNIRVNLISAGPYASIGRFGDWRHRGDEEICRRAFTVTAADQR